MCKRLFYAQGIHFLAHGVSRLQGRLQKMPGNLDGQRIGDHFAGAILVLNPRRMRKSYPYWPSIYQKLDIHRVGMAGSNGNDQRLINAVHFFLGPAVHGVKISVHDNRKLYRSWRSAGKRDGPTGALNWAFSVPCVSVVNYDWHGMKNLGILLSGRGSNFEAIAKNVAAGRIPGAHIAVVISNRADAGGLAIARSLRLTTLVIPSKGKAREEHDREVAAALQQHQVDLICLAGYMRLLSPWFVKQFPHRILNIHPSLLPAFPGLEAQQQAFAYGVKVSGCTVHFVDEELDHGPIVVQRAVPVLDTDDEHTLAARILEQEHIAYSEAIKIVLEGGFEVVGRRLVKKGQKEKVRMQK